LPTKTNLVAWAAEVFSSSIINFGQFFYFVDLSAGVDGWV